MARGLPPARDGARRGHGRSRCGRPGRTEVTACGESSGLAAFSAHTSGDPCHTRAVATIVAAHRGPLPAVLMGDFNAPDTSPAIRALTEDAGLLDASAT